MEKQQNAASHDALINSFTSQYNETKELLLEEQQHQQNSFNQLSGLIQKLHQDLQQ